MELDGTHQSGELLQLGLGHRLEEQRVSQHVQAGRHEGVPEGPRSLRNGADLRHPLLAARALEAAYFRGGGVVLPLPPESILQVPSKNTPRSMTTEAVVRLPRTLAGAFSSMDLVALASPW